MEFAKLKHRKNLILLFVKGLYETDKNTPGHVLAGAIYGPSYLSFDYALARYQLIPEAVYNYTSATYFKRKKKTFETDFGVYTFRNIPTTAFPVGILIETEGAYQFQIASPEKALCDKLYTLPPALSMKLLEELLFDDLRIDLDEFHRLDFTKIKHYAPLYRTTNHKLLLKIIRRLE